MSVRNFFIRLFGRERTDLFCGGAAKAAKVSFASVAKLVRSPQFQCAALILLMTAAVSLPAFAQGLDGGTETGVETTAKNLFNKIFDNWRVPFTGLGLLAAGIVALSDDVRGPGRAIKIAAVVIGIALIPSILRVIAQVSGTNFQ